MADQEAQRSRSSRARRPSERSIVADAHRREQLASQSDAALDEADALIATLHELELISQSTKPDRRTIAFAVAGLRGELPAGAAAQTAQFGLAASTLYRARANWVDDDDARLQQAMAYRALAPDEVHTPFPCLCPRPRPCTRPLSHLVMVGALRLPRTSPLGQWPLLSPTPTPTTTPPTTSPSTSTSSTSTSPALQARNVRRRPAA